ncbi:hypothetical protein PFISCL1PPCAC_20673, partial [Pristionchus fissidentatus]
RDTQFSTKPRRVNTQTTREDTHLSKKELSAATAPTKPNAFPDPIVAAKDTKQSQKQHHKSPKSKDKDKKTQEDDSTQRIGVVDRNKGSKKEAKGGSGRESKDDKKKTKKRDKEDSNEKGHEKVGAAPGEEKRANCMSIATKRERKHPSGAANTAVEKTSKTTKAATTESDRTQTQNQHDSKKGTGGTGGKSTTEQMDYLQRRRKKQLEKVKLLHSRNAQLTEVPVQRLENERRIIEDQMFYHGYLWKGDLDRM